MLNTFPELLTYGFFAPLLLRASIAFALLFLAFTQWKRRQEAKASPTYVWVSMAASVIAGIALLVGYGTQIAALLAIVIFVVGLQTKRRYPSIVTFPASTVMLLVVICISLLITGAGAFAMDLPL